MRAWNLSRNLGEYLLKFISTPRTPNILLRSILTFYMINFERQFQLEGKHFVISARVILHCPTFPKKCKQWRGKAFII